MSPLGFWVIFKVKIGIKADKFDIGEICGSMTAMYPYHEICNSYLYLCSNDKQIFYVNKDVCMISKHLTKCLESGMKESAAAPELDAAGNPPPPTGDGYTDVGIHLDIEAEILEICIKFMHYKLINRKISMERPSFDIEPAIALRVLEAATQLGVWTLWLRNQTHELIKILKKSGMEMSCTFIPVCLF